MILDRIEHRIVHPGGDLGFQPAGTAGIELALARESSGRDLAIKRRAAEAGTVEHYFEAKNSVRRW